MIFLTTVFVIFGMLVFIGIAATVYRCSERTTATIIECRQVHTSGAKETDWGDVHYEVSMEVCIGLEQVLVEERIGVLCKTYNKGDVIWFRYDPTNPSRHCYKGSLCGRFLLGLYFTVGTVIGLFMEVYL